MILHNNIAISKTIDICVCYRVWSVRYNHFHDQLVLSSSSDSRVILNNVQSLSSEPYGHTMDNDDDEDDEDRDPDVGWVFLLNKISVSTERLKWRPMLRQIWEVMLLQKLHVCMANNTEKIVSSDWL